MRYINDGQLAIAAVGRKLFPTLLGAMCARLSALDQYDPPDRTAAGALDAGQQLGLARDATAAVMPHAGEQSAERHIAPSAGGVCLVQHAHLAAVVALDAQASGWSRASAGVGSSSVP
jgi:hypothetical protein